MALTKLQVEYAEAVSKRSACPNQRLCLEESKSRFGDCTCENEVLKTGYAALQEIVDETKRRDRETPGWRAYELNRQIADLHKNKGHLQCSCGKCRCQCENPDIQHAANEGS